MNAFTLRCRPLLWVVGLCLGGAGLGAADLEFDRLHRAPQNLLRESYAQAATLQMQTYRWEIDAALNDPAADRGRYQQAQRLVREGEQLVIRMRSAHPAELEAVRVLFDRNREELDRVLGRRPAAG